MPKTDTTKFIHRYELGEPVWVWLLGFAWAYECLAFGQWPTALGCGLMFSFVALKGKRNVRI